MLMQSEPPNPKFESRNLTEAGLSSSHISHIIEGNYALQFFFTVEVVCSASMIINSKNMILSQRVSIFIIPWTIIEFMLEPREPRKQKAEMHSTCQIVVF